MEDAQTVEDPLVCTILASSAAMCSQEEEKKRRKRSNQGVIQKTLLGSGSTKKCDLNCDHKK